MEHHPSWSQKFLWELLPLLARLPLATGPHMSVFNLNVNTTSFDDNPDSTHGVPWYGFNPWTAYSMTKKEGPLIDRAKCAENEEVQGGWCKGFKIVSYQLYSIDDVTAMGATANQLSAWRRRHSTV